MSDKSIAGSIHSYIDDKVGYIILDNPDRLNAISLSMWEQIGQSLKEYKKNKYYVQHWRQTYLFFRCSCLAYW